MVAPDGSRVSYRELDARVTALRERLGPVRRLVLVAGANEPQAVVAYLACLRGRHPVLLTDPGRLGALTAQYDPDVMISPADDWAPAERRPGTAHRLHPELALLLATSGSTGSPKLVRLSADNIVANAAAIAEYLDIRPADRAVLSLPVHYCYGLSVANSNLSRGAALLLTDRSVTDPEFWPALRRDGATSLHGVPYTFELLDRVGFADMPPLGLRYITQAGGRMDPAAVRRYAELGARQGWRFFVMYGQTEATARMAYLPSELAATCPWSIGRPIPGGSLRIESSGELVYRGPNVMLGYAHKPADLALGRAVRELRTGDLARQRPDGLYEVTGRVGRFIKPFGLRIDLDQVEHLLGEHGWAAAATGDDTELVVVPCGSPHTARVGRLLADRLGLPRERIRVVPVDELPRLPNGKVDRPAVAKLTAAPPGPRRARWRVRRGGRERSAREAFRAVFGARELPAEATFVSLGGDSLSYVRMSVELQRVLGQLPRGWERMSVGMLEALPRRPGWATLETAVPLRALAIVLVVGSHVGLFYLLGGAHLLLAMSGWAFARFVLPPDRTGSTSMAILRGAAKVAVPSALWIAARAATQDDVTLLNALLVNHFVDPSAWGYWYVETLVQALLLLALVFTVPWLDRAERAHPFWFALVVLLITVPGPLFPDTGNQFSDRLMSTHLVFWLFVLGWLVQRADSFPRQLLVAGLVIYLVPGFFHELSRTLIVTGGLLLLLAAPRMRVPGWAVRPLGALAASSLAIYLTHYAVFPHLLPLLPPVAVVAACLVCGVAADRLYNAVTRHVCAPRVPTSRPSTCSATVKTSSRATR